MRGFRDSLALLIESDDAWVRTVALHVAGVRHEHSLREAIERASDAVDARVRETAAWALRAIGEQEAPCPTR